MYLMISAYAMSIKKAPTSDLTRKAFGKSGWNIVVLEEVNSPGDIITGKPEEYRQSEFQIHQPHAC
jgi:hypothetical protein